MLILLKLFVPPFFWNLGLNWCYTDLNTKPSVKQASLVKLLELKPNPAALIHFSKYSSTAARSPSPRAVSGSVCAPRPSERGPPLQRERTKQRDAINKQQQREKGRTNVITPVLEEATNIVQKWNRRPCSHTQNRWGTGECVLCVRGDGGGGEGVTGPDDGGDQTWINDQTNDWH